MKNVSTLLEITFTYVYYQNFVSEQCLKNTQRHEGRGVDNSSINIAKMFQGHLLTSNNKNGKYLLNILKCVT